MKRSVHFVLDEVATLGHLLIIEDMLAIGRGYSIRMQFYLQSVGQLKTIFPVDGGQTLLSNSSKVFFGISDIETAKLCSEMLGDATIVVDSGGSSSGYSRQTSEMSANASTTYSRNSNSNWQQVARRLQKPEELMTLPQRTCISFTPGVRPILTTLVRYYEDKAALRRPGFIRRFAAALRMLVVSAFLLAIAFAFAAKATQLAEEKARQMQPAPMWNP